MNSSNNVRIKTIELSTLANLTNVFIAPQQAPRKRTFWMRALLTVLALYPATAALAAAECNRPIAELYENKSPTVVLITALTINPYRMDDRIQLTTGSGFIIDTQGLVMTNSHVVFGAQALTVTLDDGTALPAKLLGADPIFDLAILQIPKPDNGTLPTLAFADSDGVRPGDDVIAIGNPLGLDQTITRGIVSGLNRFLTERPRLLTRPMIQTDTAINPGNSGGPLLNLCGDVIGVTSEIIGNAQNIGFAIPANLAKSVVTSLASKGHLSRPWFGANCSLIDAQLRQIIALPLTDGFLVEAVEPNSPASIAGIGDGNLPIKIGTRTLILGGDIIVAINDIAIKDPASLQRALDEIHIDTQIRLKVFRQGKILTTEFKITERPLQPGDVPESSQSFSVKNGKVKNNEQTH